MKSVIELVRTPQGFSIVENGNEINKSNAKSIREKSYTAQKKYTQQNFTIYPYIYSRDIESSQKYIIMPSKAQWFNLNQVSELEKKALPEWFRTRKVIFGSVKPDKFEKNEELYRKYRNYIIELGKNQYVSPTKARKGLAGDACAIIRIHNFLEQWGLINYVFSKQSYQKETSQTPSQKVADVKLRKDCIDKDKTIFEKHYDKDYLELLKKITKKYRPACHLCEDICGVIWYEYSENLYLKKFQEQQRENGTKMYIVTSQEPFSYLFRLCASCFNGDNLPVVLSYTDFKKKALIDQLHYHYEEPKDKKKVNEQNKVLELFEKNRLNIKKTAEVLKISEEELYEALMFIPILKIEKMARIEAETDIEQYKNGVHHSDASFKQEPAPKINGSMEEEPNILKLFENQIEQLSEGEVELYEQLIQRWLLMISAKVGKLNEWEKSTQWFSTLLMAAQKNILAEQIKKRMIN